MTRLSSCYTKSSVQYWAQIEQVIWTNISFNFAISMSGYIDLTSQQNNGTKSNSRQKHQLFCKIFFYREGQEKAFYHNVRILFKAKQETVQKRDWGWEEEVLQILYTMQWSNKECCLQCNEAERIKNIIYDAMKQHRMLLTMQWSRKKKKILFTMQWSNKNVAYNAMKQKE